MPIDQAPCGSPATPYILDEQVGFLLRQVHQRHTAAFAEAMSNDLTPTQWAALAKLAEIGVCSQNQLGRLTAMDVATIKGVVDRLVRDGHAKTHRDPSDARRIQVALTSRGVATYQRLISTAQQISAETLAPLRTKEREIFLRLLGKLL